MFSSSVVTLLDFPAEQSEMELIYNSTMILFQALKKFRITLIIDKFNATCQNQGLPAKI